MSFRIATAAALALTPSLLISAHGPREAAAAPAATPAKTSSTATATDKTKTTKTVPKYAVLLKDAKKVDGLIPLYRKDGKVYAELSSSHYKTEYIVLISIARGIGRGSLLGGMSWGFGDDWVWRFRKIDNRLHIVRRNVRFRARRNTPEASAVRNAYTDSVLFSLPIATKGPRGGDLVDLTPVFMSDLPQISQELRGFAFSSTKSAWAEVKGFQDNIELEVAATYASNGRIRIDSVPDSRGVTVNVHYSISKLANSGYVPRLADDRVGYFLTAVMDYSKKSDRDQFVRYINRWNLQKADPLAKISPPKKPIIFWIEKTVPFKYRKPIRDGILEWNRAFEKAGFVNAIEVRQQRDDAEWDPEDINYNTFRWITSNAGFAMGPSRVNPYTGEILDADIIFDASFLQFWKREFETLTPETVAAMTGGRLEPSRALGSTAQSKELTTLARRHKFHHCMLNHGMAQQFAFGTAAVLSRAAHPKQAAEMQDQMILQGLKEVTMHEVGHTLGLRHNFKASKYRSLADINDPQKSRRGGASASVMDYTPANIMPKDRPQGDFFTPTLGPYDVWAIQYGYTPFSGGTNGELSSLQKIASRSGERALAYATDEDTNGMDPDPDSNRFDLGEDALEYARTRAQLVRETMPDLLRRTAAEGENYTKTRQAFNVLLAEYGQSMYFVARYVGGVYTSRSHKGDKNARPPLVVVPAAKQREALRLLEENVLNDEPFQFPPQLYNYLASSNWSHWGVSASSRKDFPVHDAILMWQDRILAQLLSSTVLKRMHDTELNIPEHQDTLTSAELIQRLTQNVFADLDGLEENAYSNRRPAISSLRRNLQRAYLRRLGYLALGRTMAPEDCQTIAFAQLDKLASRMQHVLDGDIDLDSYSEAHLLESTSRIKKILEAKLSPQSL